MKVSLIIVTSLIAGSAIAQAGVSTNLLTNPSFEESDLGVPGLPAGWECVSTTTKLGMSITAAAHQSGLQGLRLTSPGVPRACQMLTQRLEVVGGGKYTFNAGVINDASDPLKGTTYLQLCIEWLNEEGRELSRNFTHPQGQTFSKNRWALVALGKVKAPSKAVRAVVGIHMFEGERGGKGSLLIDDVVFERCDR